MALQQHAQTQAVTSGAGDPALAARPVLRRRDMARSRRMTASLPLLMILPSLLLTVVIIGFPIVVIGWTSFHRVSKFGQVLSFNGLANYWRCWRTRCSCRRWNARWCGRSASR